MRIARIDLDGPVTAIADGDTLRPLPGVAVLDLLAASPDERARLAAPAGEPVADARLLAPLEPASVRDYSVFEQHGEGASMAIGGPDAKISPTWYEMPAFYFSNPHATTGPDEVITPPAGTTGLDLELEVAAIVCRRGRNLSVEDAEAPHRRLHDLQRLVGARHRGARGEDAVRLPQDEGLREHLRPLDRDARRARALPPGRPPEPAHDRLRQRSRAGRRHARLDGVELPRARRLRGPRRVDRAG